MALELANLPRLLEGAEALAQAARIVRAAREAPIPRSVAVLVGLGPNPGALFLPPTISPYERIGELGAAYGQVHYLGLFQGAPPEIPSHPPNLTLVPTTPAALAAAADGPFAVEAVSLGGVKVELLSMEELAAIRRILLPSGEVSLYLFGGVASKEVSRLVARLPRAGFTETSVTEVVRGGDFDPLPRWPRPIRTLVRATARAWRGLTSEPGSSIAIGLKSALGDRFDPEVSAVVEAWYRGRFPGPLRTVGDHEEIESFARGLLREVDDPALDQRRNGIVRGARAALGHLSDLFPPGIASHQRVERRRPFVVALGREFFRHHEPPFNDADLWRWLEGITGTDHRRLRDHHEADLLPILGPRMADFTALSRERLHPEYRLTGPEVEAAIGKFLGSADHPVTRGEVDGELQRRFGLGPTGMNSRFGLNVRIALWRGYRHLERSAFAPLKAALVDDLPSLEAAGVVPFDHLPLDRRDARIEEALAGWIRSLVIRPRPTETIEAIQTALRARGIEIAAGQLPFQLVRFARVLWEGVDGRKIDPLFMDKVLHAPRPGAASPVPAKTSRPPSRSLDLDALPPTLESPEELSSLVNAARAAGRNISLFLGDPFTAGPPAETIAQDLARFFREGVRGRFVNLWVFFKALTWPGTSRPGNLTFFQSEVADLSQVVSGPFAAEVSVIAGHRADHLTRGRLEAIRDLLLPESTLNIWLPERTGTMPLAELAFRVSSVGFQEFTLVDVRSLAGGSPLPSLRGLLKTLVTGRVP